MAFFSMSLALVLLLSAAATVTAQQALSAWNEGVATNYGGSSEGRDANTASYGLQDVSNWPGALPFVADALFLPKSAATVSLQAVSFTLHLSDVDALFLPSFLILFFY